MYVFIRIRRGCNKIGDPLDVTRVHFYFFGVALNADGKHEIFVPHVKDYAAFEVNLIF